MLYTNDLSFNDLIKKVKTISEKGYIKGVNNNLINSCGLTLEKELGKKPDSLFFPDFKDIEIKCKQRFSKFDISLFTISFDGPNLFESNYILGKYGKKDSEFKEKKTLNISLILNEKVLFNNKYYFELKMDYDEELLYINIYDKRNKFIEKRCFISFDSIKQRLNVKLSKLAIIRASKKKENENLYFRYYKVSCYILKDFHIFLNTIENRTVKCSISLRFARSGKEVGKNKNKNFIFSVSLDNLDKIYNMIYSREF